MCRDYLLNNRCSEFEANGKCSYSHSLFTRHNQEILKKLHLSAKDWKIFDKISELIRASEKQLSEGKRSISDDDHEVEFRIKEVKFICSN